MKLSTLNNWADRLFDTGKRNNLVNFRNTKTGTAEIVAPDMGVLFSQAEHGASFEVYDPKNDNEDEDFEFAEDMIPLAGESYRASEERISREQYRSLHAPKLKRGQLLIYNSFEKPLRALKNISKKGRTAIEETGVNILYLAFGFIHWTEAENPQYVMKAPILLVPVTIENESALEPYRIKVADDDIIVNPTFSYKLQSELGFTLPAYENDEGIDAYFDRVATLIASLKWTVSRDCRLGIFSFLKINMYQDLKTNADVIMQNTNVCRVAGDRHLTDSNGEQDNPADLLELHNVVDADSSQSAAIAMAKAGKSFVLQGPPGTGKSQTITNIVAECLANGKRVLFVSEKLAALNVVYDKLKKVGLAEFCLELHSHKASKKQVIEELCHTLRAERSAVSDRAQRELDSKREAKEQLDTYKEELHKPRPVIGKSLYSLYEEVAACRHAPDMEYAIADLKNRGEDYIDRATAALERYAAYAPTVGYDYRRNPWYGFRAEDTSYNAVLKLKNDLSLFLELCGVLCDVAEEVRGRYGIHVKHMRELETYQNFFSTACESGFITPRLLMGGSISLLLKDTREMQALASTALAQRALLDEQYDEDLYKINGNVFHKALTRGLDNAFTRLFSSEYRHMIGELRLCRHDGKKPKYAAAVAHMETLRDYQKSCHKYAQLEGKLSPLLGNAYQGMATDFAKLTSELEMLEALKKEGLSLGTLTTLTTDAFLAQQAHFKALCSRLTLAQQKCGEAKDRFVALFDRTECELPSLPLPSLQAKLCGCLKAFDGLDSWQGFSSLLAVLQELGIRNFIDRSITQGIKATDVAPAFKKAFYTQWVDAVLHATPALLSLSRIPHDEAVRRFKEKDELHFEINKAKIRAALSAQRPGTDMVAQGSAISILLREGEKRRKQKGVRQLLSEIGDLALALKPCFLMSPLSVSTFLAPDMHFDTVIFDEASQIFPQDAIGAIYRGKQLIVVGDSKQMPPSNFFSASADTDESESESIADFESILDLCAVSFPQCRLKWHYRSRFEQLIAFSNKNFYDNELVTFPSAKADTVGIGVDYDYVDGVFDRQSKTNRAEAERVAELVFEHVKAHPERSLGVVAFSISQQNLIERLIAKKRQQEPDKEAFFRSDRDEPFFVKNLETVQGDERDTVIFSVAYAKDAAGKLLLNFGPINREGGERRLNVAVTRAKYNVVLVSSMHGSDIDLSRTHSVGVRLLKEYLDYAEHGTLVTDTAADRNAFAQRTLELEGEIREFLRDNGYEADLHIGRSSFKIDVAVKQQDSPDYALAIECDGVAYRDAKTARDRDRLRQMILENMGWRFYRVWSSDWFRSKRIEKERLLSVVKNATRHTACAKRPAEHDISFEEAAKETHFSFPKYQYVNVRDIEEKYDYSIPHIVRAVLEKEAPVAEEWLLKRIVHLFGGREKITAVVLREYEEQMRDCRELGILRKNGFLYLYQKETPMLRAPDETSGILRDIKHVAIEELAQGLHELLRQNVSAEKNGLFRLLVQHLGATRISDAMHIRLEAALRLILKDIDQNGDMLSLKSAKL